MTDTGKTLQITGKQIISIEVKRRTIGINRKTNRKL